MRAAAGAVNGSATGAGIEAWKQAVAFEPGKTSVLSVGNSIVYAGVKGGVIGAANGPGVIGPLLSGGVAGAFDFGEQVVQGESVNKVPPFA